MIINVTDPLQNLSINNLYPQGFYRIGQEIYEHKASALIRASSLGVTPTWHFHENVFEQQHWQTACDQSLSSVYQMRAKQLRDCYDYLVLSFSGGSDSWTALKSFVDSHTHLDEIFVRWPIEATNRYAVSTDDDPSNILSEWKLTIMPMLKLYAKLLPNTRITVYDWSQDILRQQLTDDDWIHSKDHLNPGVFLKFNSVSPYEMSAIESGKKTAIIFGIDKPQIMYKDGNIYCYFLDKLAGTHAHNSWQRTSELFYWSHDAPEVVVTQAKIIYHYLLLHPELLPLLDISRPFDRQTKNIWDRIVRCLIYPDYTNQNYFQARKGTSNIKDEVDNWMLCDLTESRYLQSWQSNIKNILGSVNEQFLQYSDRAVSGFVGFISGSYLLGPARSLND